MVQIHKSNENKAPNTTASDDTVFDFINNVWESKPDISIHIKNEGLDGGGGWYSLFIKNLAHHSSY